MMLARRSFLGLLSSACTWLLSKSKLVAAPVNVASVLPEGFVASPAWCPKGFLPMAGQSICKEQFPYLFTVRGQGRHERFVPAYFGKDKFTLPKIPPLVPTDLQAIGWQDRLTICLRPKDDTINVTCIATEPQRAANGRVSPAGFTSQVRIKRQDYEKAFGKFDGVSYDGPYQEPYLPTPDGLAKTLPTAYGPAMLDYPKST